MTKLLLSSCCGAPIDTTSRFTFCTKCGCICSVEVKEVEIKNSAIHYLAEGISKNIYLHVN
jgi:hypothetical protein